MKVHMAKVPGSVPKIWSKWKMHSLVKLRTVFIAESTLLWVYSGLFFPVIFNHGWKNSSSFAVVKIYHRRIAEEKMETQLTG